MDVPSSTFQAQAESPSTRIGPFTGLEGLVSPSSGVVEVSPLSSGILLDASASSKLRRWYRDRSAHRFRLLPHPRRRFVWALGCPRYLAPL